MFFFSKKYSIADSGIMEGMVDNHCHLLPGVDDGVKKMEETLILLQEWEKMGVKEVWFTSHIMEDVPNTPDNLKEKFEEVKKAAETTIQMHLAAENMLDPLFEKRLSEDVLLTHKDNLLLVETSYYNAPYNMEGMLGDILNKGYTPLLAHPERYAYMEDYKYEELKNKGIKFQLNLPSLTGAYGDIAKKKAEHFLKLDYYDCVGTDTHSYKSWKRVVEEKVLSGKVIDKVKELARK